MEPLGGRKPSELLADMWELCPANQHENIFFAMLFLQRLPRDIRVMLTHEDHGDLRRLAGKAEQLVAFGGCTHHWSYSDQANNCTAPCSWQGN